MKRGRRGSSARATARRQPDGPSTRRRIGRLRAGRAGHASRDASRHDVARVLRPEPRPLPPAGARAGSATSCSRTRRRPRRRPAGSPAGEDDGRARREPSRSTPGAARQGGDLGERPSWRVRGPLEDAIFGAEVGAVVGPIRDRARLARRAGRGRHAGLGRALSPRPDRPSKPSCARRPAPRRSPPGWSAGERPGRHRARHSSIRRIPSTACRATGIERRGTERMTRIVVTGGSGKAGRAVVHDLVENGHDVVNVDVVPASPTEAPFLRADLTDLRRSDRGAPRRRRRRPPAAIPAPRIRTVEQTFEINMLSTYNVFSAAALLGLERVVWASSETVLGLPFGRLHARNLLDPAAEPGHHPEPDYVPIDEAHPLRPHSSYSLSKVAQRGDGPAVRALEPDPVHRPAVLRDPRAGRVRCRSPRPGAIRTSASGTSGATSTPAMSPRPAASP